MRESKQKTITDILTGIMTALDFHSCAFQLPIIVVQYFKQNRKRPCTRVQQIVYSIITTFQCAIKLKQKITVSVYRSTILW